MKAKKLEELTLLFLKTKQAIKRNHVCVDAKEKAVSAAQMELLWFVSAQEHPPTMLDIARHFKIKAPSATGLVKTLVDRGELKRVSHDSDRRVVAVVITKKGEQRLKEGFKGMVEHFSTICSTLTAREIDQFISILKKLSA